MSVSCVWGDLGSWFEDVFGELFGPSFRLADEKVMEMSTIDTKIQR